LKKKKNNKRYTTVMSPDIPSPESIQAGSMIIVGGDNFTKWAYFKCPCGCGDVLSLSLMNSVKPNWWLEIDDKGLPTIYPSVWKKDGCESHFWIKKGRVRWARFDFYRMSFQLY
jgi:hypothetical protein